jgi:uncharacterized membrane protein YbhN (UPF0104 family)
MSGGCAGSFTGGAAGLAEAGAAAGFVSANSADAVRIAVMAIFRGSDFISFGIGAGDVIQSDGR